jgi:hypothetical protein
MDMKGMNNLGISFGKPGLFMERSGYLAKSILYGAERSRQVRE